MQSEKMENIARQRLEDFFDKDSFVEIGRHLKNNQDEISLVCGYGKIGNSIVYGFSQNGSICRANIKKMKLVYSMCTKTKAPLVGFYDSNGLDLSEGIELLDEFGELILAQNNLSGLLPQISVIMGACISVNALLASSADFLIMSDDGSFYVTPPEKEDNGGTAKAAAKSGVAHLIAPDDGVLEETRKLVGLISKEENASVNVPENAGEILEEQGGELETQDPWIIAENIFDNESITELFPSFGANSTTGMALLNGETVGFVGTKNAHLDGDDASKIARLVYVWDSLNIPVVTFINTTGIAPADGRSSRDFAKLAHVYAEATVPKIAVVTGKAYGSGYVTFASRISASDYTVSWPSAIISPLPPHTSVAFLQGDMIKGDRSRSELELNYIKGEASALSAAKKGIIDDIIPPKETRDFLINGFNALKNKQVYQIPKKHGNIPF